VAWGSGHSSILVVDGNFKSLKGSCQCFLTQENLASTQFNGVKLSAPGLSARAFSCLSKQVDFFCSSIPTILKSLASFEASASPMDFLNSAELQ